ncbi:hypothetical protein KUCAC02_030774, partial [Chaenocephalus aceratus]
QPLHSDPESCGSLTDEQMPELARGGITLRAESKSPGSGHCPESLRGGRETGQKWAGREEGMAQNLLSSPSPCSSGVAGEHKPDLYKNSPP